MDDLSHLSSLTPLGLCDAEMSVDTSTVLSVVNPLTTDTVTLGPLNPLQAELDLTNMNNVMDFILPSDTQVSSPMTSINSEFSCIQPTMSIALPPAVDPAVSSSPPSPGIEPAGSRHTVTPGAEMAGPSAYVISTQAVSQQVAASSLQPAVVETSGADKGSREASSSWERVAPSVDGQAVQLEDGSTAVVENKSSGGLHAVHLQDGSIAYITDTAFLQLFSSPEYTGPPLSMVTEQMVMDGGEVTSVPLTNSSSKPFRCTVDGCGKSYSTQNHLKVHARSHTGMRPFICPYLLCQKQFTTSYALKAHIRTHTGEKPYVCPNDECRKGFKTSGDLSKHIRIHTGERPFICPFEGCGRSFTTSNIRKVHIRVHTGEKPFSCDMPDCKKTFSSSTNYKNHMRMHRGERPYVCTVPGCDKRFTEYSSLYKHHTVHTKGRSYTCGFCRRAYRQSSTLSMHIRTAHSMVASSKNKVIVATPTAGTSPENAVDKSKSEAAMLSNFVVKINETTSVSGTEMKMAVIDDPTLRNLIAKMTEEQIENQRHGIKTEKGTQVAPVLLQMTGEDRSLGQLYLVTDPVQLRLLKTIASKDRLVPRDSLSQSSSDPHISSVLIGGDATSDRTNVVIGSDSVASLDSVQSSDLIGQLMGGGDSGCSLTTSEIFSMVPASS